VFVCTAAILAPEHAPRWFSAAVNSKGMSTFSEKTRPDSWARLSRVTGVTGLITIGLLFGPIIAISTLGEPPFVATAEQARAFFVNGSVAWAQTATAATNLAAIGLVWFVVGLTLLLGRAEGSPPWRSMIALVSGVLVAGYLLVDASWEAASFGAADLDTAVASYAFDVGNLGFANAWLALASFAVCCGWVVLATRVFGRWLGWWAIVSGVGLALSRFFWTAEIWFAPYGLFWIWVIIVCVLLLRSSRPSDQRIQADVPG
jgi:hypothetical protein